MSTNTFRSQVNGKEIDRHYLQDFIRMHEYRLQGKIYDYKAKQIKNKLLGRDDGRNLL